MVATQILIALVVLIAAVPGPLTQGRPNFTGTWTLDWTSIPIPPGSTGPGTGPGRGAPRGGSFGEEFTATHDAATLTIAYIDNEKPVRLSYRFDDVRTAVWQGSALVLRTPLRFGDMKRTLSLEGGQLVVQIELPIADGPPMVSKIRYTKR